MYLSYSRPNDIKLTCHVSNENNIELVIGNMLHFSATLIKGGPTPSSSANVIWKSYLGLLHCKCGSRSLCGEASPFDQLTTAVTIRNYLQEVFSPLKIFYPWLSHCLKLVYSYTIHPTVTYAAVKSRAWITRSSVNHWLQYWGIFYIFGHREGLSYCNINVTYLLSQ